MTYVKALLDMTYQQCPGFVMVTVSMVVGMVLLQVTGKRTSPVRSQILPSSILLPEVTSRKNACSLDDFLVVEMFINEGLWPTPVGRVESKCSAFRPRETPLLSISDELLQCLHHASWCSQHSVVSTLVNCDMIQWKKRRTFLRCSSKHLVFGAV